MQRCRVSFLAFELEYANANDGNPNHSEVDQQLPWNHSKLCHRVGGIQPNQRAKQSVAIAKPDSPDSAVLDHSRRQGHSGIEPRVDCQMGETRSEQRAEQCRPIAVVHVCYMQRKYWRNLLFQTEPRSPRCDTCLRYIPETFLDCTIQTSMTKAKIMQ